MSIFLEMDFVKAINITLDKCFSCRYLIIGHGGPFLVKREYSVSPLFDVNIEELN